MVRVTRMDTGPCELFLKLESQNPGGSIKDRIGLAMIETAERSGLLQPGATVIEATAGNTGLGLALVARAKGYRVLLVVPDKMSSEKVLQLKALGAEVRMTRSDVAKGHPEYYQDIAASLARSLPNAWYADQFNNPANPLAHETTTAPEIWHQMGHRVDALVCGVGSGGTLAGLSRYFERVQPALEMILADPAGSILKEFVETGHIGPAGSWAVEGIGEDFVPPIADLARVRHAFSVTDEESFSTARALYRAEGILAGSSTGTLLAAALRYCRAQVAPKRVVSLVCDTGTRYLSKVYNDPWMFDQGLLRREAVGDLRDLISRRPEDGAVVSVTPEDSLSTAFSRMRAADVSQLPVLESGRLAGLLDESDLLTRLYNQHGHFTDPVRTAMSSDVRSLKPSASLAELASLLKTGFVAVIADDERFYGMVTRFDLLNHLRKGVA